MNNIVQYPSLRFVPAALLVIFLSGISTLAATFSVLPAVISNDYRGMITLQIGDLINGETVLAEKFADFDGNGAVDGDDFLVESLRLTDGVVSTIGGATNFNVPSDVTGADGAIIAPLNFAGMDFEHAVGQYTFRATSPGRFTNTASFSVTNSAHAQSISGVVRCGTTSLSNALVVFLSPDNDYQFSGSTVTDTDGNYSFRMLPGFYAIIAAKSNYVFDFGNPPIVNVTSNASIVTNLDLLPATTLISGKLADWSTTNGLPGVFGTCESADGLLALGWTGPDGEIRLPVTSNVWRLEADGLALAHLGYVSGKQGTTLDTTQGPVTNLLAQLPKATAMFHGKVQTDTGTPLAAVRFWGGDQQPNGFQADGCSDTNGNYSLGVLSGQSWCGVGDDVVFRRAYIFTEGTNSTLGSNQAIRVDFLAKPVTGRISGRVRNQSGSPVSEVGVYSFAGISGRNYSAWAETDGGGNYSMNVANGSWHVNLNCWGDEGLENRGYECVNGQIVSVPPTDAVANFTVYPIGTPRLDPPVFTSPGQLAFALYGRLGTNYIVERCTDLHNPSAWSELTRFTPGSSVSIVRDPDATNRVRFYRARIGP